MTKSVSARLKDEVAARRMEFDVAQREAADRLTELGVVLRGRRPGLLRRALGRLPWANFALPSVPARGIYLWGSVGTGKTLLMDWFFASLQGTPGVMAERSHFYRFMRSVHAELATLRGHESPLEAVAQRIAARVSVICLDEFFVADIADAMILAGLFAGLFSRGVTLVTTSNLPPEELYKDGLQRQRFLPAIELIRSHVEVVHVGSGIDYRLRQLEQAPTYLDSTLLETAAALESRFAALAGSDASGPSTLVVENRPLRVHAAGGGVVWFEFRELCEGPRSQNDYIELARTYGTFFISGIPRFGTDDEDAARRFIMLIDELYDRGVKLVVSAAAPPAALYQGERLSFEFQRTASRLVEMQTQHYLAREHRA